MNRSVALLLFVIAFIPARLSLGTAAFAAPLVPAPPKDERAAAEKLVRDIVKDDYQAVQAGADSVDIGFKGRDLIVSYNVGNTGLGAARIPKELEHVGLRSPRQRAVVRGLPEPVTHLDFQEAEQ